MFDPDCQIPGATTDFQDTLVVVDIGLRDERLVDPGESQEPCQQIVERQQRIMARSREVVMPFSEGADEAMQMMMGHISQDKALALGSPARQP